MPGFSTDVSENFKHTHFDPSGKTSGRNFTLCVVVILSISVRAKLDSSISADSEGK